MGTLIGDYLATNPYQQPQAPAKKKTSLLESLLPTAGGIGGGALGGAAGGALAGSAILPGVGTIAGGLLGALAGGFTGGAAGKAVQNKLEGQSVGHDVLKEGAIQGVLSAGPLRLAKGIGTLARGGKAAAGVADAVEAGSAASKAAEPLRTSTAGKLKELGDKALESQYGTISKPVARATNPTKTISQLADMGVVSPKDAERIAHGITGSNGILTKSVADVVGTAGKVPVGNVKSVLKEGINKLGLVDKDAKSLTQTVEAQLKRFAGDQADPQDVMKVMKSVEKRVANLEGQGSNYRLTTPERLDQAKVLRSVKKELEDSLYKGAGADANVKTVLTPELRANLVKLHPNNAQWEHFVDTNVMKAKSVGQLRSAMAPFVRVRQIIDEGDINGITFGGRIGNSANGGVVDRLLNAGTELVKNPAAQIAGKTLRKASGATPEAAAAVKNPYSLGAITKRSAPVGLLGALAGQDPNIDPNMDTTADSTQMATNMNTTDPNNISMDTLSHSSQDKSSDSPLDPANLETNIERLLRQGATTKDINDYVSLVSTVAKLNPDSSSKKLNSSQQQQANNAQSGLASLQKIASTLQANPNAAKLSALPGGSLSHALTGTGEYDAAIKNATDVIGRLRSGGAIQKDEETRFLQMLPRAFDDADTVQYKLQSLASLFNKFANPQPAAADDNTDLLTALGAQ